jgi:hypothetical protein
MKTYLIALLFCLSAYGGAVDGNAVITTVKGTGKVNDTPYAKGSLILNQQRIFTDKESSVILWLSNGSRMVVNQNAVVHFKTMKQEAGSLQAPNPEDKSQKETGASITEIEVESGKVIGDVKKLAPNSIYTLKTPVGVVSIKGTVFSVEYKKNDDGTVAFNIGCLVGRVTVQMADPNVPPVSVPAGKQLSISAPAPIPTQQNDGQKGGDKKEEKQKEGDNGEQKEGGKPEPTQPAPPPPPMKMQMEAMPPKEMAAIRIADVPPPPPPAPPPPAVKADALDNIMQKLNETILKGQVDVSPSGG